MKQCANCFSTETWIDKNGYENWRWDGDRLLCNKCNSKLITNPRRTYEYNKKYSDRKTPEQIKDNNDKRLVFMGKTIHIPKKARTGYCSLCRNNIFDGSCKQTHMHHLEYHPNDPLEDTVEVCVSCHRSQHENTFETEASQTEDEYSW